MASSEAKLECLSRAALSLRAIVIDLERHLGSEEALIVAAGAMRTLSAVERTAQRIALETEDV